MKKSRLVPALLLVLVLISTPFLDKLINTKTENTPLVESSLIINEYMSENKSTLVSSKGEYPDWIEIFNRGSDRVELGNYAVSDDDNRPGKWKLPSLTLNPGEYFVLFASGSGISLREKKEFHTNFKLGSEDKFIVLSRGGSIIDKVEITRQGNDVSMGREAYSDNTWSSFREATPGFENTHEGYNAFVESKVLRDSPLVINEYMYVNKSTIRDEDFDYPDWIEIYNQGEATMNLKDYGLSDNPGEPFKWRFPEITIDGGQHRILFASGKDRRYVPGGGYHTNFRLDEGETVMITTPEGRIMDKVEIARTPSDYSLGRTPQDIKKWVKFSRPTPGYENSGKGYSAFIKENSGLPGIVISEALPLNNWLLKDEDGDYSDWIELYNASSIEQQLEGYSLTDDMDEPHKWSLPGINLKKGQFLLIYASGKNRRTAGRNLHTNFKIDNDEGAVFLFDSKGNLVDKLVTAELPPGKACGRPGEGMGFAVFEAPTPGSKNPPGYCEFAKEPIFSLEGGFYKESITLSMDIPLHNGEIRYTLDGSIPTRNSQLYKNPVKINKTTVVRARVYSGEELASTVKTSTYFINPRTNLTVLSVSTNPENFWDENTGIYVKGKNASSVFPYVGANFWMDIEKPIHIELYETDGGQGLSMDAGIKIFGAYSRAMDQKSFAIYAREEYGEGTINYGFFKEITIERFQNIVLRTSGQDAKGSKIKDAVLARLASDMGLDSQACRPAVLYVNGEYFGIYNIREKIDEYSLAANHDIDNPETIDLLEANGRVKKGTNTNYRALIDFVSKNDLRLKENYEYVKKRMDVENYMDYQIAQIYYANIDNGNIRFWREGAEGGKWRWIVYDTDLSYSSASHNSVAFCLDPEGTGSFKRFSTLLIRKLLENDEFREAFLRRFAMRLNTTLKPDRVVSIIDGMARTIEPEMPYQIERWGSSMERWRDSVNNMKFFAKARASYLYGYIKSWFNLSDDRMNELGFVK